MRSIIFSLVKSPYITETLIKLQDELSAPIKISESLSEYAEAAEKDHVGLMVFEYERIRYLSDEERRLIYRVECPKVAITKIGDDFYFFAIPAFHRLDHPDTPEKQKLVNILNKYFYPLPAGSLFSGGEESQFITRNPYMLNIFKNARRVAQFNTQVLLLGESGTGKDVLAEVIHRSSQRSARRMVKINCAAIPANLLETEMFGYRKGAFTNAFQDKIGKLQLANGSSLFLNEIGEMNIELQAKLLRVIESGEVDVIGGINPVRVDVRIISATNRNLQQAVFRKDFREDLYYRLNVVKFELLPLRDRMEDVRVLFDFFVQHFAKKYEKRIRRVQQKSLAKLYEYHWPGNVRELRNFVERLVIQVPQNTIGGDLIESEISRIERDTTAGDSTTNLNEYLARQEESFIRKILAGNNYKILDTAEELGISRASLFRKMKKYKINAEALKSAEN